MGGRPGFGSQWPPGNPPNTVASSCSAGPWRDPESRNTATFGIARGTYRIRARSVSKKEVIGDLARLSGIGRDPGPANGEGTLSSPGSNRGVGEFTEYAIYAQPVELPVLGLWISRIIMGEISVLVPESVGMNEKSQLVGIGDE